MFTTIWPCEEATDDPNKHGTILVAKCITIQTEAESISSQCNVKLRSDDRVKDTDSEADTTDTPCARNTSGSHKRPILNSGDEVLEEARSTL